MMTSTLPLLTLAVVACLFNDDFNFTSGKIEVIIKQKRYYSKGY
jgi:hypothetical protein